MIWVDYVIIGIIGFSVFIGLIRGFIREALSLIILGYAFFVTSHYYPYLAVWLTEFDNQLVRNGIAIVILFIFTLLCGTVINYMIGLLVEKTGLSGINRFFGVCFGITRGILIIFAMLFFMDTFTDFSKNPDWQQSQLIPKFSYIIKYFLIICTVHRFFTPIITPYVYG